jgi:hypothetical protein
MQSPTLQQCHRSVKPFGAARRSRVSVVVSANNGETRQTTVHKLLESQGQLMVPGTLPPAGARQSAAVQGVVLAQPPTLGTSYPFTPPQPNSSGCGAMHVPVTPCLGRPADCVRAALQAAMMRCLQRSWGTAATKQPLSVAMQ